MLNSVTPVTDGVQWPKLANRLLLAIAARSKHPGMRIRYAPAAWLKQRGTPQRRQRWSRWTKRLANAGMIYRLIEPTRDRVTEVALTPEGRAYLDRQLAILAVPLEELAR